MDVASIRRQGKSWQAIVRRKGHPAKSKAFPKKALAEAWARRVEEEVSANLHINSLASQTTLTGLLTKYGEEISPRKKGGKIEGYRLETLKDHFKEITLDKLSPQSVLDFVDKRIDEVSSDSVRKELNLLSSAINAGMALWKIILPANPVVTAREILKFTQTLTSGVKRERRPTLEELVILYASPIGTLVEFAVETGMRRGEICNIKDTDRAKNILHIPETKTDTPRTIPLSKRACELIDSACQKTPYF